MKAFILAAGLGSRLAPLTHTKPKALVEINGKPMLQHLTERLIQQGFDEILVNVHHFSRAVIDFLEKQHNFGVSVSISDESTQLLDTGGAILKAADFFKGNEPVLVHNVDVYTDMNFIKLMEQHQKSKAVVSPVVRNRHSTRKLLFDKNFFLAGWKHLQKNEVRWVHNPLKEVVERAYSGVYVASPQYPEMFDLKGSFSIIDQWLSMANRCVIRGVEYNKGLWFDLGSVAKIKEAENSINGLSN